MPDCPIPTLSGSEFYLFGLKQGCWQQDYPEMITEKEVLGNRMD
jgi:hypothetical protein